MSNIGVFKFYFFWAIISAFGNSCTFKRDFSRCVQNNLHGKYLMTRNRMCLRKPEERKLGGSRVGSTGKCSLPISRKTTREKHAAQEMNANRNAKETQLMGMCKIHCNNFSKTRVKHWQILLLICWCWEPIHIQQGALSVNRHLEPPLPEVLLDTQVMVIWGTFLQTRDPSCEPRIRKRIKLGNRKAGT